MNQIKSSDECVSHLESRCKLSICNTGYVSQYKTLSVSTFYFVMLVYKKPYTYLSLDI